MSAFAPGKSLFRYVRDTNHPTRNSCTGVADRLAAIIRLGVDDHAPSNDRILSPGDGDVLDGDLIFYFAVVIGLEVPQIASVSLFCGGQAVLMALRVVMAAGAHPIGGTAIAELVDVYRVLLTGGKPLDQGYHFNGIAVLSESNLAMAFVPCGRVKHCHCLRDGGPSIDVRCVGGAQRSR